MRRAAAPLALILALSTPGVIAPPNPSAPHTLQFVDPNSWSPC